MVEWILNMSLKSWEIWKLFLRCLNHQGCNFKLLLTSTTSAGKVGFVCGCPLFPFPGPLLLTDEP